MDNTRPENTKLENQVIIFLGAPGAGKGTQAARLATEHNLLQISTGDILRDHIARGTELGQRVEPIMKQGHLVPDDVLVSMIGEKLQTLEPVRVIFDGFPRTLAQAEALDQMLLQNGTPLNSVLLLEVPTEELIARIVNRGISSERSDDNETTARARQQVYHDLTQPVVEHYRKQGLVQALEGRGSTNEVYARILEAVQTPA